MISKGKATETEKIILGVDPGTSIMGYGLIHIHKSKITLLQFGVIHLSKYNNHGIKLSKIFERVVQLIDEYHPDEMAIESPFYGKNVQSMLKLGRAQGVAIAAAISREVPISEYAPKKVKQAVTGNGNASKEQVSSMLCTLLKIQDAPKLFDSTDALAVALCHHFQGRTLKSESGNWSSFLKDNPDRIIPSKKK